ncbi:pimeloyl-ACP methyl ester carboxylesterase [Streptomyces sp. 3211.6]|uniref:alpha/beta fold hydrolase n=1 Tax=Streptomyces sp. 3211.6 TaxID=1938845 RepID=UPI000EAC466B|nr:alpha/beta hydrolase [Streptomyces sp. 3211.6]RKT02237.1 pimeloyl-ACP methyl ester carboxylesterase [Streptomyces sp. 3211.6]
MREYFTTGGRRLSYLDFGGQGKPLLALHGHYNEASAFAPLAEALAPRWRVIALDQRGHGESDRADSYGRGDYVADLLALHRHLGCGPVPVLGHSLGGVNAYQFAAHHPDRVERLIVEDIGAVVDCDWSFTTRLPAHAPSRQALAEALGSAAPYLECAFRRRERDWGFSFGIEDTIASQKALCGDHRADWTAVPCPTLLVRGTESDELTAGHARTMVALREGRARLVELAAGHVVHHDAPEQFAAAVTAFLAEGVPPVIGVYAVGVGAPRGRAGHALAAQHGGSSLA